MATTAIFAEILIAGFEALAWLSLLVFGVAWVKPVHLHGRLSGWETLGSLIVVGFAYALGVLVDRAADTGHRKLESATWLKPRPVDRPEKTSTMRMLVLQKGGPLSEFLEYQKSKLRIARATALNFALLGLVTPLVIWRRDVDAGRWLLGTIVVAPFLASALSELAYRRIQYAYVRRLTDAYKLVSNQETKGKGKTKSPKRGAAIPYTFDEDDKPCVLLVSTKSGDGFTFPKGKRKRGTDKSLADTAEREAREEAGVRGLLDGRRVGTYRYAKADGETQELAAFLLEVKKQGLRREGDDAERKLLWLTLACAQELLSEGQAPEHQLEVETLFEKLRNRIDR